MAEGFETEVLAALRELRDGQASTLAEVARLAAEVLELAAGQRRNEAALHELTEGQHRVEAALALVRQDLGERIDRVRDDLMVTTSIASSAEERADDSRAIVRQLVNGQQELRRRIEKLEDRDRGRGPGEGSTPS